MKKNSNDFNDNNGADKYLKRSFIRRLPFGVKATFIKYWFYGALYFFCFMGLGNYVQNEDLVLVTGLIGGVLFDIALYNIYLLIAETREEASRWWIFKSKHFYSIFINIIVLIGMLFAFYYIIVPINMAKPSSLWWLFQEPLSAAVLLTILDTAIVWAKNGLIILFKRIFKKDASSVTKEDYIKILKITPVSISVEINNNDAYYANKPYNVLLNNEIVLKKIVTNSFTIYDLKPDTQYHITINRKNVVFTTPKIYKFYKVFEGDDIQKVIDSADQYSLIIVNKGTYKIKSLVFKNNLTVYLRKGVSLITSDQEADYPIIPAFIDDNNEVYGNCKGEPSKMRQSIIHIDHLKNVDLIGEGSIDSNLHIDAKTKVAPPHLIFINHSSNISIIGLSLKNSPQWTVHPFFSSNINLINLEIVNSKDAILTDGITPQCSKNINIVGCHFANLENGIALKAGKNEIAFMYRTSTENVSIRNCHIEHSNNAICLGSENSSGISSLTISRCYFVSVGAGIVVNTKRGSGKDGVVRDVKVEYSKMDGVGMPITMNMFYSAKPDEEIERVLTKKFVPIDNDTPYLGDFIFKNIEVKNFEYACGYFYGLPEKFIYEIKISDSSFIAKDVCQEASPILGADKCSKRGFIAKNVRTIELKNVRLEKIIGKRIEIESVGEVADNQ